MPVLISTKLTWHKARNQSTKIYLCYHRYAFCQRVATSNSVTCPHGNLVCQHAQGKNCKLWSPKRSKSQLAPFISHIVIIYARETLSRKTYLYGPCRANYQKQLFSILNTLQFAGIRGYALAMLEPSKT